MLVHQVGGRGNSIEAHEGPCPPVRDYGEAHPQGFEPGYRRRQVGILVMEDDISDLVQRDYGGDIRGYFIDVQH